MSERDMDSIHYQRQAQRCYELASILKILVIILERYKGTKQFTKTQQTKEFILDLFQRIPRPGTKKEVDPSEFSAALKIFYQSYRAAVNEEARENEDCRVLFEFLDKLENEIYRFDSIHESRIKRDMNQ